MRGRSFDCQTTYCTFIAIVSCHLVIHRILLENFTTIRIRFRGYFRCHHPAITWYIRVDYKRRYIWRNISFLEQGGANLLISFHIHIGCFAVILCVSFKIVQFISQTSHTLQTPIGLRQHCTTHFECPKIDIEVVQ